MTDKNTAYANWLKNLTKTCLPIELQKKIIALQPLTRDEAEQFAKVLVLAGQARQLVQGDKSEHTINGIAKKIDRIYDNKALKRDLAGSEAGREQLAAFGLVLTEPQKHANVKAV